MRNRSKTISGNRSGFTLIELLVVVAIFGVLAAIALTAVSGMRASASKTSSVGNLKNFAAAMHAYTADNGKFPGSDQGNQGTLHGISPIAKANAANSLQVQLMSYLQVERPAGNSWGTFFLKSLSYPAWYSFNRGTNDNSSPSYVACQNYTLPDGTSFSPFGGSSASSLPMTPARVQAALDQFRGRNDKPYLVIEADQLLYNSLKTATGANPSWKKNLSTNALHGKVRNVLYFDGSVRAVSTNQTPYPW